MIERSLDSLIEIFLYRDKLGVLENSMTMIFQYIFLNEDVCNVTILRCMYTFNFHMQFKLFIISGLLLITLSKRFVSLPMILQFDVLRFKKKNEIAISIRNSLRQQTKLLLR